MLSSSNISARRMLTRRAFSTSHTFKLVSQTTMQNDLNYCFSLKFLERTDLKAKNSQQKPLLLRMNCGRISMKWRLRED